jgi:hypothetical protein
MGNKIHLTATALACTIAMIIANPGLGSVEEIKKSSITWDENSHLVKFNDEIRESVTGLSEIKANPEFVKIVPDLHFLIKRSYRSTKRDDSKKYVEQHMLEQDEPEIVASTGHSWHCLKNFQGQQGEFVAPHIGWKILRGIISPFVPGDSSVEVDYPGFVAYKTDFYANDDIIWLVVVLRGSQGEDFQPLNGMLGSSWITNYSAGAADIPTDFLPFKGKMHSGYLNKMMACRISMNNSINEALSQIGEDNFHRVRFIITGHSQGGGLAQVALAMIIKNFSYIYGDSEFDNNKTPRFFGYFMSSPCILCGKKTTAAYKETIGEDNMIRHESNGDIVPMLCLSGYHALGILAIDPFYDTLCRSVRSETAYCSRYALFSELRYLFDQDKFDIDPENDTWTTKNNPDFKIHFTEIAKIIGSHDTLYKLQPTLENLPAINVLRNILGQALTQAFYTSKSQRIFEEIKPLPNVSDSFILALLKKWYNAGNIELLVRNFIFFKDITLDEARKERIFLVSDEFEQYIGNGKIFGIQGAVSTVSSLNAVSETINGMKDFDSKITTKCGSESIPSNGIIVNGTLSPIGKISAVASAHFGSCANYNKATLFDQNVPSKDINLALRNGSELLRPKKNKKDRCVFIYEEGLPQILIRICEEHETPLASN